MKKETDVVFNILQQMLANSPVASYKRLNPALRSTLADCLSADLPFQPNTFRRIYNELRGSWWFGDGAGSHVGEHYYSQAVELNHASAYQSFEQFAGRPGVLWEETAKTPMRLCVGARFTWQGYYVTVTSMRTDSLVACTYKDQQNRVAGIKVGAEVGGYNHPYVITATKRDGEATLLRVIKSTETQGDRDVARRFTITYEEITKVRRTSKERLKAVCAEIAKCNPEKDAKRLSKEISDAHFRHFELEEITAAFNKRKDWIANQDRIAAWRKGTNGAWLAVKENILRVNGDRVECSNGNSVSVAAVRRALPIVLDQRQTVASVNLPLDGYTINRLDAQGVKIGCTFVAWSEVDLLQGALK